MTFSRLTQLELAIERMLQRNAQLQDSCLSLQQERTAWQQERRELLSEVEGLLADLSLLHEEQG